MTALAAGIVAAAALIANALSDVWGPAETRRGWSWTSTIACGVFFVVLFHRNHGARR